MVKGVVLAAGAGTRLRPLTLTRPKALCLVGGRPLVDWAVGRIVPYVDELAVNVHHYADQIVDHFTRHPVECPLHISVEMPVALGTAGALGRLREWLAGGSALVTNVDAWYPATAAPMLDRFVQGWDGERVRLLCVPTGDSGETGDFDDLRYVGTALLPWAVVRELPAAPAGLYEASWQSLHRQGRLDLVQADLVSIDCGTPADLARADGMAAHGE